MEGLLVKIDKYNEYTNTPTLLQVCKSTRRSVFMHLNEIIGYYLENNAPLPKWCLSKVKFPSNLYPGMHQKIQDRTNLLFSSVPPFLNIKNGFLAGGSIAKFAFEREWESKDIDIFVPMEGKHKRVKVYLDEEEKFLDLVFKNKSISDFDISVCQIGMDLQTRDIYVTLLFLYSLLTKEMVIHVSDLSAQYTEWGHGECRLIRVFDAHTYFEHKISFHKCAKCVNYFNYFNDLHENQHILTWFARISKYEERFPDFKIKFIIP